MFSNHVYKIIILPTLLIRIPNLEIFLFCQHNSTAGGNLEFRVLWFTFQLSKKKTIKVIGVRHRLLFSFFFQNFQVFTRNECRLLSPTSKKIELK
jgi:hypothetical protein